MPLTLIDQKRTAEIKKLKLSAAKEQRMLDVLDDLYLPREEVEVALAQIALVHEAYRSALEQEFPSLLAGMTPAQIQDEVKQFNDDWAAKLGAASDAVWEAAREATRRTLRGDLRKVANNRRTTTPNGNQ